MAEISMREKVAEALSGRAHENRDDLLAEVAAVLAAMREPTVDMIYAGEQAINANIMGAPGSEDESVAAWKAMIDAA